MGIRIQHRDIDVPKDNPFKNDLLDRQEAVEVLTDLVGNIEGPCVMAVDADWGAGKTTFLKIWAQHLRNEGYPLVKINAWKTDFSEDPFVTLSSELTEGLRKCSGGQLNSKVDAITTAAQKVLQRVAPGAIRLATAGLPIVGIELGKVFSAYAEEKLSQHQKAGEAVGNFTRALQDSAGALSNEHDKRPLILMIDEVDRCRPSYAVELLEVSKHLFAVDHIVFVLAVNRTELAHSVRALYGGEFNAEGYLCRFFDVDFRLPEPNRDAFINTLLKAKQIDQYFDHSAPLFPKGHGVDRRLLLNFFSASDLSLRTVAQAIHRLGLALASERSSPCRFALATTVALILRTIDPDLYNRFTRGEVTDLDVVKSVFNRPGLATLHHNEWGVMFGALLVLAAEDRKTPNVSSSREIESPLSAWRPSFNDGVDMTDPLQSKARFREYTERVFERVDQAIGNGQGHIEFELAVRRLELLTHTLIGE